MELNVFVLMDTPDQHAIKVYAPTGALIMGPVTHLAVVSALTSGRVMTAQSALAFGRKDLIYSRVACMGLVRTDLVTVCLGLRAWTVRYQDAQMIALSVGGVPHIRIDPQ